MLTHNIENINRSLYKYAKSTTQMCKIFSLHAPFLRNRRNIPHRGDPLSFSPRSNIPSNTSSGTGLQ